MPPSPPLLLLPLPPLSAFLVFPRACRVLLLWLEAAVVAVTTTVEQAVAKAPVVVEKKGKARDKELVGSIPKVCRCVSPPLRWACVAACFGSRL